VTSRGLDVASCDRGARDSEQEIGASDGVGVRHPVDNIDAEGERLAWFPSGSQNPYQRLVGGQAGGVVGCGKPLCPAGCNLSACQGTACVGPCGAFDEMYRGHRGLTGGLGEVRSELAPRARQSGVRALDRGERSRCEAAPVR
jgi:hypothetical protein